MEEKGKKTKNIDQNWNSELWPVSSYWLEEKHLGSTMNYFLFKSATLIWTYELFNFLDLFLMRTVCCLQIFVDKTNRNWWISSSDIKKFWPFEQMPWASFCSYFANDQILSWKQIFWKSWCAAARAVWSRIVTPLPPPQWSLIL